MVKISAYIIAYNEEEKVEAAVNSVLWADEIVLADSQSIDQTAEIAESLGARVVQIPFSGFGKLRNRAVEHCRGEWIFSLDADERCTPEVRDEILELINSGTSEDVFFVPRKNFFMGKWIQHSGFYPNYRQPQLFKKGSLKYKPDPVHEGFEILSGRKPGYLKSAIWQFPFKDFDEILEKAGKYSSLGAARLQSEGHTSGMFRALGHGLWSFGQHYFLKLGMLDGWAGFIIALGNFEGTFYKYAKLHQLNSEWQPPVAYPLRRL